MDWLRNIARNPAFMKLELNFDAAAASLEHPALPAEVKLWGMPGVYCNFNAKI